MQDSSAASLKIGNVARQQLRTLEKKVVAKLFEKFIQPVLLGYLVQHLEGKYKPSWILPEINTNPFKLAMANLAKKESLHHYHFGFPYYSEGRDKEYPGKVSDAIVHTIFFTFEKKPIVEQSHTIIHIDPTHPTPFTIPTNLNQEITEFNVRRADQA